MGTDGLIHDVALLTQPIDYTALLPYPLAPTDVDGLVDVDGYGYILIEVKRGHTKMPMGQQVCLENMVKDFQKAGKKSVLILLRHEVFDQTQVVYAAFLPVVGIYDGKKWREPRTPCLAHEFVKQTFNMWKGLPNG